MNPPTELARLREGIPLLEHAIPMNHCSQAPQTRVTRAAALRYLDSWNERGMDWDGWMIEVDAARSTFARLIGAEADEVAVFSSVSHATAAVASCLDLLGERTGRRAVALTEAEFPTVAHVWKAREKRGTPLRWIPVDPVEGRVDEEAVGAALDDDVLLLSATHGDYQTGALLDLGPVVAAARDAGVLTYVDAYQSLGTRPLDVKVAGVDMLASGNLKFLMGIPGIAFLYVRRALAERLEPAVTGWFGRADPFAFEVHRQRDLDWAEGARRFDGGTPPILAAYVARAGMEGLLEVGLELVGAWTRELAARLIEGGRARGLELMGPSDPTRRTPTVAFRVPDAHSIEVKMRARGIIASARGPALRLAPHVHSSTEDVDRSLEALAEIFGVSDMGRERFASRLGVVLSMIGVAVGLGNVWRFPYMLGSYGGSAFLLVYLAAALLIGVPALMAEWALGRHTRRGTVGAFERAGLPGGRSVGWFFFLVVTAATAYYVNVIGWVAWHGVVELSTPLGRPWDGAWILPPDSGVAPRSLVLQGLFTAAVIGGCALVLRRGLRRGIERASRVLTPLLFGGLLVLTVRSVTLPGSGDGLRWLLDVDPSALTPAVMLAALSQVIFSLALGGTFMVVYGSYLDEGERLGPSAVFTVLGDTGAGLLAGLAIVPAVFALGMEPGSGPGLLFATIPAVLAQVPGGWAVGAVFFVALGGAAFLSAVAAFEVLVAGLTDNTGIPRGRAVLLMAGAVLLLAIPPMINMKIFVPWDLTFGSGMQTLGALVAAVTFGWALDRGRALEALASGSPTALHRTLHLWIRFVIPLAILTVGGWWLAESFGG